MFLPGYDDIVTLRDRLTSSKEFGNARMLVRPRNFNIQLCFDGSEYHSKLAQTFSQYEHICTIYLIL